MKFAALGGALLLFASGCDRLQNRYLAYRCEQAMEARLRPMLPPEFDFRVDRCDVGVANETEPDVCFTSSLSNGARQTKATRLNCATYVKNADRS